MLKYLYKKIIFSEIPNEITLGISISGCQIHCPACNQRELWEDKGSPLTVKELNRLLDKNKGITCVLFLGGEHDIDAVNLLSQHIHNKYLRTAWYCGLDFIPKDKNYIMQNLDYVKLGHYDPDLGGLDSPTTNQRLYSIEHQGDGNYWTNDITFKLRKHGEDKQSGGTGQPH